jgi:hypothetical protein
MNVNERRKTSINTDVHKNPFISLQLHTRKYGKVAEIGAISVGVKVSGNNRKNERKWKCVDIGGFRCEKDTKCFPIVSPK